MSLTKYITDHEKKLKTLIESKPNQSNTPKRFVAKKPQITENKNEKNVKAFIQVLGETLFSHGLNEDKINEIIDELFNNKTISENNNYQKRIQNHPPTYGNGGGYSGYKSNPVKKPADKVDLLAEAILESDYDISQAQAAQAMAASKYDMMTNRGMPMQMNMPTPLVNSVYEGLKGSGERYAPTIGNIDNMSGEIKTIEMPKELQSFLPTQQKINPVNIPIQTPISTNNANLVETEYGMDLI